MNTICANCGDTCPGGTLDNGLCSQCDMIGKRVLVMWGRFGYVSCLVQKVSHRGTVYASLWNKKQKEWTSPRPIKQTGLERTGRYWILSKDTQH